MKNNNLITHWSLKLDDWVSTIKSIVDGNVEIGLVGCRNGKFIIVDSFGTTLYEDKVDSWIGDIDYLKIEDELHIFLGTKNGSVVLISVLLDNWQLYNRQTIYQKKNTIRGVKTVTSKGKNYLIAVGEDKSLDIIEINIKAKIFNLVSSEKYNGWLRCIEVLPDKNGDDFWLCFGCGDKHIHFFNFDTKEKKELFVGYKTHCLKYLPDAQQLVSSDDGNNLNIINWLPTRNSKIRINFQTDTFQRINSIERQEFGTSERILLLVGDFKTILTYDLDSNAIIKAKFFRLQVHSLEPFLLQKSKRFLIGYGSNELSSINYSYERKDEDSLKIINNNQYRERLLYIDESIDLTNQNELNESDKYQKIHEVYCGKVLFKEKIGIGRFIFTAKYGDENYIIVATDEGNIKILKFIDRTLKQFRSLEIEGARIWSVAVDVKKSSIYVGTSNSELLVYDWMSLIEDRTENIKAKYNLSDWPREIRLPDEGSDFDLFIGCEDGTIYILKDDEIKPTSSVEYTIRTISQNTNNHNYSFIIGTDQNCALAVDNKNESLWSFETKNRVREIKKIEEFVYVVSEDRFVYKLTVNGNLAGKIRLPHRVLCIAENESIENDIIFVGCGDGNIYELTKDLCIVDCYRTYDRIRDIEIVEDDNLIVAASEDNHLYVFKIKNNHLDEMNFINDVEFVQNYFQKCKLAIHSGDDKFLSNLKIEDKYYLLRTSGIWHTKLNIATLLYLIDSLIEDNRILDVLDFTYTIVKVLYNQVIDYDEKTALNRVEKLINHRNQYFDHALWVSLLELNKERANKIIINLFRLYKRQVSDWGSFEIARVLNQIDFFEVKNLDMLIKNNNIINSRFFNDVLNELDEKVSQKKWINKLVKEVLEANTIYDDYLSALLIISNNKTNTSLKENLINSEIHDDIIEIAVNYHSKRIDDKILSILLKHYFKGKGELIRMKDYFILYILNKKIKK